MRGFSTANGNANFVVRYRALLHANVVESYNKGNVFKLFSILYAAPKVWLIKILLFINRTLSTRLWFEETFSFYISFSKMLCGGNYITVGHLTLNCEKIFTLNSY